MRGGRHGRERDAGGRAARIGLSLVGGAVALACGGAWAAPRARGDVAGEAAGAGGPPRRPGPTTQAPTTPTGPSVGPAAAPTSASATAEANLPAPVAACGVAAGPTIPVAQGCEVGAPVGHGELLLWPRACRLQVEASTIDRHTIELRDLGTGQRRAQISLPGSPATGAAPRVGALVAGALPLYVHAGGVTAIDIAGRKAEAVHEAEHGMLGFARLGDWLALVESVPPDAALPDGGVQWTVLDSEAGRLLGEARIAGRGLRGLGVARAQAAGKLVVWLRMAGRKGEADLVATIDAAGVADGDAVPLLKPAPGVAPTAAALVFGDGGAPAAGRCAVIDGFEALVVERPWVRVSATGQLAPARGLAMVGGECLVAMPPRDGATWALRMRAGRPELARLTCAPQTASERRGGAAPPGSASAPSAQ